jgi:flagellar M-ring protein FliF
MLDNVQRMWRDASAGARLGLVLAVLLLATALTWSLTWALRRDEQVLFADLEAQDAATIVGELERMKMPYRLAGDGTTILVERQQVHATRLKLMGKGVPLRGGVGFEIFSNNDFGMTDFAQRINYQRALQGELARTIAAFEEVRAVRVHLVLPESGLFRKSGVKPKAAVTVSLKRNRALAAPQVLGIQRLVAAAVPEIESGAVTIVDEHGVTLSRPADSEGAEGLDARNAAKDELEQAIARKAVSVLDRAFGPGRAIVSVDVTLDHNQVRVTREEVLPGNGRSGEGAMTRKRTTVSGGSPAAAAAAAATPSTADDAPRGAGSTSEFEYQNGRRVEQVVSRPGSIRQISIGILLPHALAPDRAEQLRRLIGASVGLNAARGDELAISSLDQFGTAGGTAAAGAALAAPPVSSAPLSSASLMRDAAEPDAPGSSAPPSPPLLRSLWWLAALALALVVGTALLLHRRQRRPALSRAARADMLRQLRGWLAEDRATAPESPA